MEENSVNLIDSIECKYKDLISYFKLAPDDEKNSYFNVSEKPERQ